MAKFFWAIVALALIGTGIYLFGFSQPPEDAARATITGNVIAGSVLDAKTVSVDASKSTFGFVGYGPGKSHVGSFDEWTSELLVDERGIVGFSGTIQTASVTSDNERVTNHLKNEDFFDVALYPTIVFETTGFDEESSMLTGLLTFRGITKEITFPVSRTDDSLSADFVLNTKPFNMKYEKITNQVKISFELVRA